MLWSGEVTAAVDAAAAEAAAKGREAVVEVVDVAVVERRSSAFVERSTLELEAHAGTGGGGRRCSWRGREGRFGRGVGVSSTNGG
ncbi:uncharacterized protein A4U43_C01F15250 [Asparagus officinalis]|uniref:Uncharacterized protein n=1 Tax=Asparagus officinalis TaxID=4686 RepID=A0A5P1FU60_ASPOF|nr:uncharacterized protein A4U43_C01F15250 [Asparagus officinalis]